MNVILVHNSLNILSNYLFCVFIFNFLHSVYNDGIVKTIMLGEVVSFGHFWEIRDGEWEGVPLKNERLKGSSFLPFIHFFPIK